MNKATIVLLFLLFVPLASADFTVSPKEDSFEMLQNRSIARIYMVSSNDTTGKIDVSTSVDWTEDTTDYINVTPGRDYSTKVTFSPGMMAPGDYNVVITFTGAGSISTVRAPVKIVKTSWVYNYLFENESYRDIVYKNLTTSLGEYALVSINGKDSFLIKNNKQIVKTADEIKQFYNDYYKETIYPTQEEIDKINDLILTFSRSRNLRTQYGPAESTCKQYTGMNDNPCYDTRSCELACSALVELCGPAMGALGPSFVQALVDFGTGTDAMDRHQGNYFGNMSSIEYSNVASNLQKAKEEITSIKTIAQNIKNSKLRYDLSCMECYGMCPAMPYNITALDEAMTKISALSDSVAPIDQVNQKSAELQKKTNDRMSEIVGKQHKIDYQERYDVIEPLSDETEKTLTELLTHVQSPELERKLVELKNTTATLEFIIENGDYTNITLLDKEFDSSVDRFYSLKGDIDAMVESTSKVYEKISEIRNNATYFIVKAEMNVQVGDGSITTLQELRQRMEELDANFTVPMKIDDADSLEQGYYDITYIATRIAESKPSTSIVGRAMSKIIRTERDGAAVIMGAYKPLSLSEKTHIGEYIAPVIAATGDLLLAFFMCLFLAVYIVKNRKNLKRRRKEIVLFCLFSAATLVVAIICTGIFYYLTTIYGGEGTLNLFLFSVEKAGGVAVFVDHGTASLSSQPENTKKVMTDCGEEIADALSAYSAQVYLINNNSCSVSSLEMNYSDCENEFGNLPIVYVRHGSENIISFRTVYAINATIEGTDEYISDCSLGKVLR